MKAGVLFDRDATLIDVVRDEETGKVVVAFHPNQIRLLSGAVEGLKLLRDAGYLLAIVTNQPGPAKGEISEGAVTRTNAALVDILAKEGITIASVAVCMHHQTGAPGGDAKLVKECECRKPKPGLLNAVMDDLELSREQSWMVGDSVSDIEAGLAAGLKTALVFSSNRCELCPYRDGIASAKPAPHISGATLADIARKIINADIGG